MELIYGTTLVNRYGFPLVIAKCLEGSLFVESVYIGWGTSGDHTLHFLIHSWFQIQDRKEVKMERVYWLFERRVDAISSNIVVPLRWATVPYFLHHFHKCIGHSCA